MNWYKKHKEQMSVTDTFADKLASVMGSWELIIFQTVFVVIWMTLNIVGWVRHWDGYPFILLNLLFSTQSAYAAPIIMMSQNRQSQRDRAQAEADYQTNLKIKDEIEDLQRQLSQLELEKLDKIIHLLEKKNELPR